MSQILWSSPIGATNNVSSISHSLKVLSPKRLTSFLINSKHFLITSNKINQMILLFAKQLEASSKLHQEIVTKCCENRLSNQKN